MSLLQINNLRNGGINHVKIYPYFPTNRNLQQKNVGTFSNVKKDTTKKCCKLRPYK